MLVVKQVLTCQYDSQGYLFTEQLRLVAVFTSQVLAAKYTQVAKLYLENPPFQVVADNLIGDRIMCVASS